MNFHELSRWRPSFRWVPFFRRVSKDTGGATLVEFSILLFPFLALVLFIMETGLQLFITSALDNEVRKASRQLQIGTAHTSNMTGEDFKNTICRRLPVPSACDNLIISVTEVSNWTDVTARYGAFNDRRLATPREDSFCLPREKKIVLVRSFLKLPVISGFWLASDPNGTGVRGVTANHIFRMEPMGGSPPASSCAR